MRSNERVEIQGGIGTGIVKVGKEAYLADNYGGVHETKRDTAGFAGGHPKRQWSVHVVAVLEGFGDWPIVLRSNYT